VDQLLGRSEALAGGVDDDGREVGEDTLQDALEVGDLQTGAELDPDRGGAVLQVDEERLVGRPGVGAHDVDTDVPVALAGGTSRGGQAVEVGGRADGG